MFRAFCRTRLGDTASRSTAKTALTQLLAVSESLGEGERRMLSEAGEKIRLAAGECLYQTGESGGNLFDASERDFENARAIEKHLAPGGLRFVHPPIQCQCLCAVCYPKVSKDA